MVKSDYSTPLTVDTTEDVDTTSTARSYGPTQATETWYNSPTTEYTAVTNKIDSITTIDYPTTTDDVSASPTTKTDTVVTYEGDYETVDDHKKHDKKHNVPTSNSPSLPNICDGYFDAIATLRDELFVFKDQYIWRYKEKGKLEPGYPIPLSQMFPKLPKTIKKIDAAYQRADGMIVIFTGKIFWISDGTNFIDDNPKPLTDYGLPAYLKSIDAVQTWGKNKKIYFYKNERFWRYNETAKAMDPGYPLRMERWRGVPENINAATTWKDGITYFFRGELFWKFDNDWMFTTEQSPLPTAQIWFGCPEEEHKMIRLFSYNER